MMQKPAKHEMIICNVPSKRYYLKYVKVVLREFNLPHFLVEDLGQLWAFFLKLLPVELQ